ncbi:MAG: lytic transglycosylase domain-containing protein [Deltaproteobacteria bacterium]|nr:lytic transglycosylase domain-containing protein [Deltaproteobacteria bacterium]
MRRLHSIRKCLLTTLVLYWIPTTLQAWCDIPVCAQNIRYDDHPYSELDAVVDETVVSSHQAFIPWTEPISIEEARSALHQARDLVASGQLGDALLQLRIAEQTFPRVADHIALLQTDVLDRMNEPKEACRLYAIAERSINRSVAAQGRVGSVLCRLEAGDRAGEKLLQKLLRRYPKLPAIAKLRFALAKARETWRDTWGAIRTYQAIYLNYPESPFAEKASAELERIRAQGYRIRHYTFEERVTRAERLVYAGPPGQAREAVQQLLEARLPSPELRARLHLLAARIAKMEGRWSAAQNEVELARHQGVSVPEAGKYLPPARRRTDDTDAMSRERVALKMIRQIQGGGQIRRLPNIKLLAILRIAVRNQLAEIAEQVLVAMRARNSLNPKQRFDSATLAVGTVSDEAVAGLLKTLLAIPRFTVAARYHYARALERLGRYEEADAEYGRVIIRDRSETRYYAMWAELRQWAIKSEITLSCVPDAASDATNKKKESYSWQYSRVSGRPNEMRKRMDSLSHSDASTPDNPGEPSIGLDNRYNKTLSQALSEQLVQKLQPLIQIHGAAYPWLARAQDLVKLGQTDAAADELFETYLAWRDVRGGPRLRTGLETVYTGAALPRRPATFTLRRERLALDQAARLQLAEIAATLGDTGTAVRFDPELISKRPRAYASEVERVAKIYKLDANLLFAVMRVESIYNRRIVSHAGAIGLMQIMPRTGRLIAHQLGLKYFTIDDLFDYRINLRFAAWYLSSLIDRFKGRTPLAVAAYNGGPHNVRSWLYVTGTKMPLDAFLERIPLSETHRYVRRVLTHYAAYRAQQGLTMERLSLSLPNIEEDPIAF